MSAFASNTEVGVLGVRRHAKLFVDEMCLFVEGAVRRIRAKVEIVGK